MAFEQIVMAKRYISEIDPRDLVITGKNYLSHLFVTAKQTLFEYWSPTATGIEITYLCGRRCKGCYVPNSSKGKGSVIEVQNLERIVANNINHKVIFNGLIGGEPIQEATLPVIVPVIKAHPYNSFFIYTNGDYIAQNGMGELASLHNLSYCVSVDGIESHNLIRGKGSFENVLAAFDRLREARKLYSASVTLRRETAVELTSPDFFSLMLGKGVKYIHFMKFKSEDENNLSEEEYLDAISKIKHNSRKIPVLLIFGGINEGRSLSRLFSYRELFINISGDARISKTNPGKTIGNLLSEELDSIVKRATSLN